MTKTPGDKRSAVPPRSAEFTSAFQNDWRRLARAGRHKFVIPTSLRAIFTAAPTIAITVEPLGGSPDSTGYHGWQRTQALI